MWSREDGLAAGESVILYFYISYPEKPFLLQHSLRFLQLLPILLGQEK